MVGECKERVLLSLLNKKALASRVGLEPMQAIAIAVMRSAL